MKSKVLSYKEEQRGAYMLNRLLTKRFNSKKELLDKVEEDTRIPQFNWDYFDPKSSPNIPLYREISRLIKSIKDFVHFFSPNYKLKPQDYSMLFQSLFAITRTSLDDFSYLNRNLILLLRSIVSFPENRTISIRKLSNLAKLSEKDTIIAINNLRKKELDIGDYTEEDEIFTKSKISEKELEEIIKELSNDLNKKE
ncbi:MAG: hypothetical protein ACXADA_24450 [Candidatus Hodarchaeales archaeon]